MGFQPAATELARDLQWLDGFINVIIIAIVLLVTGLLAWCILRFNEKRNPEPGTFTHNSPLEVAWTIVPILILVFIGPSRCRSCSSSRKFPRPTSRSRPPGTSGTGAMNTPSTRASASKAFMLQRDELEERATAQDDYLLATERGDGRAG